MIGDWIDSTPCKCLFINFFFFFVFVVGIYLQIQILFIHCMLLGEFYNTQLEGERRLKYIYPTNAVVDPWFISLCQ
jgi:hypothetical protein